MNAQDLEAALVASIADRHLSRRERQSLRGLIASEPGLALEALDRLRDRAFEIAREVLSTTTLPGDTLAVVNWLEDVVGTIADSAAGQRGGPSIAEAHFSPGDDCPRTIDRLLREARTTADLCVFTITDDRLSETILAAHRRGTAIRIITDNDKAEDLGSDIERFEASGIAVRIDRTPFHMHHKFAIFDQTILLTGSYNWTRGAARDNEENLIVTDEPRLAGPFQTTFERLWKQLS